MEVAVTNYGGSLVAIMVPDRNGNYANVIQGHDNIDDCINSPEPFLSTLVGRYGNRICHGKFTLNGKEYSLAVNNGPNHLHGGPTGFHARVWDAEQVNDHTLVLRYVSAYYEEGFPGELSMTVMYSLSEDNELKIDYKGTTNKKTIVNMTSHGFFSLAGIGNPTPACEDVICQINADFYVPIDENSIPTGEILKVKGTPFDFTTPHRVGDHLTDFSDEQIKNGTGYDHCFVLNKHEPGELTFAAKSLNPRADAQWKSIPPSLACSSTQIIGLMVIKDSMAQHSASTLHSALRHSTSPIALIVPTSLPWCLSPDRFTRKRPSTSLV